MIYRALRWLIVAALTALIAYVLFRSEDAVAAPASVGRNSAHHDQSDVIAATPCAPCAQAVSNTAGDRPPMP